MRVRRAESRDVAALLTIERGVENAPHWSEAAWGAALEGDGANGSLQRGVWVAEVEGAVVGFVALSLVAGVAEMESLAVLVEHRRGGIARALVSEALQWARAQEAAAMELEVRASNGAAIALYVGMGFREQGRRRGYYRGPDEDAVLMRVEL